MDWTCADCGQSFSGTPEIIAVEKKYHHHDDDLVSAKVKLKTMKAVRNLGKSGETFDTIVARLAGVK